MRLRFDVNGDNVELDRPGSTRLLDVLREDLGLIGAKEGCGDGSCGACTVLIDGEAVNACLVPVCQVVGRRVLTVEGLADPSGKLDLVQEALVRAGATQCGFCAPAFLMVAAEIRFKAEPLDGAGLKAALSGVACRCTGYRRILAAVHEALGG